MSAYKKNSMPAQLVIICIFLMLLVACTEPVDPQRIDCDASPGSCLTLTNDQVSLQLNTLHVIVENQYDFTLRSDTVVTKLTLQGLNMNMGTIPVYFELVEQNSAGYHYRGKLMLGMCAEEQMQWQLKVEDTLATPSYLIFTSYWQAPAP